MNKYFVSYVYYTDSSPGYNFGNCDIELSSPISNHHIVAHISTGIAEKENFQKVIILNWKKYE